MRAVPVIAGMVLLSAGCKKLSDAPDLTDGTLRVEMRYVHGQDPYDAAVPIADGTGRAVLVDQLRFVCGALWVQDDQHQVMAEFPQNRWTAGLGESGPYSVGELPVGHMHALVMTLGVPPAQLPEGVPYRIELRGRVDADGDGAVQPAEPAVHLYTDGGAFYYAMATSHRDVLPATNSTMTVNIDMGRMLEQIDALAASNGMPDDSVSQQLTRNLALAISGVE